MGYIIATKNNQYLQLIDVNFEKYGLTDDVCKAKRWRTNRQANRSLKTIKNQFKGMCISFCVKNEDTMHITREPIDNIEPLSFDISDTADNLLAISRQAENYKRYLDECLSTIDMEIVDIEHAAEFYELNASQGYKIYKMLHDARVKRRIIKNNMEIVKKFLGTTLQSGSIESLKDCIDSIDSKTYNPRVNKELFGV